MYIKLPGADVVLLTEGNIIGCDTASATWTRRGLRPWHVNTISTREPGDLPPLTICQCRRWPAPGRRGVIAGDVRRGEVGLAHSSGEAGEQPERSGVSGAKERGQGNAEQPHAPDTEPGKHVTEAVTRAGSCEAAEERTVYSIVPPADSRSTGSRILSLSRKAAAGVDGIRWMDYAGNMKNNITDLHRRLHQGSYRAQPGRRHYIPKADGKQRPLGIASLEDKIVQYALVKILNAVYENDFMGFSYGFRPGRSQHDALDALATGLVRTNVNWVLDADISQFFDRVSHEWLIRFTEHRIGDRRVIRLIRKWLSRDVGGGSMASNGGRHPTGCGHLTAAGKHIPPLRLRSVGASVATSLCHRQCGNGQIRR
ncbi:Group II intron-encoded protein LtrA [Klebsiella pneumoniae]|nr:Group II intron-encoded protein LtrA [Klebsiella pneumoniae]